MPKQAVFIVNTGADGSAEAFSPPQLSGPVKSIEYITDGRIPYEAGASFKFTGETSGAAVLEVEGVQGRATWDASGVLDNERLRVAITNGGKGRSGSFVVTTE